MTARSFVPLGAILLGLIIPGPACLAYDPAAELLAEAESLATAAGDEALAAYIESHIPLVGAAVGQLLDSALLARDAGDGRQADHRFDLAGRLASIYSRRTGSRATTDLVTVCRGWTGEQMSLRRRARELEQRATSARTSGDADLALALLAQAMELYRTIGDSRSIAVLWGSLGVASWAKGDFAGAEGYYQKALVARREIEDRILEGRTLNGLGSANYQLGNLEPALDYYRQAIDLRRATGDIDGLATSLTYLGNAYIALGRALDARTTLEEALAAVEQTGNPGQRYELLISIASLNAEMGRMSSSNQALEEALGLAQATGDLRREMICRNNLALNFSEAYRYGEALDHLGAITSLLEQQPDPEQHMIFLRNRGITYLRIGEIESAGSDFNALLELGERHQVPLLQLEALINLGYVSDETGNLEEGLAYAEQAITLAEATANPKMAREALILAAQVERNLGRYESSAARWNAALIKDAGLAEDGHDGLAVDVARDRIGLASVYVLARRAEEAREILKAAQPAVERSQDGDLAVAAAFCLGHSFERSHPESARFHYERGLDLIDSARAEVGGTEVRTGFLGGARRFYFEEVATYYAGLARSESVGTGDRPADTRAAAEWSALAFKTIERAKARGLLDMLEASAAATGTEAEEALLDSLYGLDRTASDYALREREIKSRYAEVRRARLEAYGAGPVESLIAAPDDLRPVLAKDRALLEFALGDTVSLMWVVDRAGCEIYRLPSRSVLEDAVGRLREAIARPVLADQDLRRSAREVYQTVLAPARDRLKNAKDLVVVPDGVLFDLPFEVLLTEDPPDGATWGDLAFLARSHAITYAPSASTYLALRRKPEAWAGSGKAGIDLVALGDPDYSLLAPLPGRRQEITPLPHTRTEVSNIAAILKDRSLDAYVGREANEAALKDALRGHPSRVVHLATHGIIDRAEPTASSIVLCPDSSGTEDGYLRTLEVMSSPMEVGLVVLSACESARGEIGRGEGVVGFGRAFLAAGARNVVASLWAVSDESTAILMEAFYRQMVTRKQPVGRALNRARLALLDDPRYAHPYYWSPFVTLGCEYSPW